MKDTYDLVLEDTGILYEGYKTSRTVRATPIESPCRVDIMNKDAFERFIHDIKILSEKHKITIEYPLPNAIKRGAYRVIFLDKHMLQYSEGSCQMFEVY